MARERTYRTESIILRRSDFGEADRLLTLFSREYGKIKAIAKGARKPQTRKSGHVSRRRCFRASLRATLSDGTEREVRQPRLRGGWRAPLSAAELEQKFIGNAVHGGWSPALVEGLLRLSRDVFTLAPLGALREFRA
jgi:hypothetical protein